GRTRWQHAREAALSLLEGGGGSTEFRVADTSGRFDSAFTTNRTEIRRIIEQMQPIASAAQFPAVTDTDARVIFVSDGISSLAAPKGVTRQSVFEPAGNVGIVAFEI